MGDRDDIPYGIIADRLLAGKAVPFLGAGASAVYRPDPREKWSQDASFLPYASELAANLATAARFPDHAAKSDLALVASYFEHVAGDRPGLEQRLHRLLAVDCQPGSVHKLLARIEKPILIMTTNYDDLMEQAYGDAPYHLVVDRGDKARVWAAKPCGRLEAVRLNALRKALQPEDRPIIYKLHGCIDRQDPGNDTFLISEQDYVDFLGRAQTCVPPYLATHMADASFLFLGYSLADWNVRVLLRKLRRPSKGEREMLRSWAVSKNPGPAEQAIWKAHGVNMYDKDLKVFVDELAREMRITLHE